jgi:hypothetical protein
MVVDPTASAGSPISEPGIATGAPTGSQPVPASSLTVASAPNTAATTSPPPGAVASTT